jgi:hypothetical protein
MNVQAILDQITEYADALEDAAQWHNSKDSIAKVSHKQTITNGADYIYEFYCYVRILSDLTHNYKVTFQIGTGPNRMKFPQGPSPKKGKPYFILQDKESGEKLFQVCAGTQIDTIFSPMMAAPDISFQKPDAPTTTTPKHTDVLLMFDAKFNRGAAKTKIGQGQLGEVSSMIMALELNKPTSVHIQFNELAVLTTNCLLTNGKAHFSNLSYHKHHNMVEVENFMVNEKFIIVV